MKLLTNLIFEPKGRHDPALAYNIKDTVMSADGSRVYFALQDVPAGIALDNEEYWQLQIDLSSSKSAMDEALASFGSYAKEIGMRVRGETAKVSGNPVTFLPDAGSLIQPVTVLEVQQQGSGDPYPAGGGRNLLNYDMWKYVGAHNGTAVFENNGVTITALEDDAYTIDGLGWPDVEEAYFAKILVNPGESITLSWEADRSYSSNIYIFPNAELEGLAVCNNVENRPLVYTATEGVRFVTIRFSATKAGDVASYRNIMVNKGTQALPFEPYSNIRPFIGYDKLGLMRHGKNLISPPKNNFSPSADFEYSEDSGVLKVIKTADAGVDRGQLYYELEVDASRYAGQMITLSHSGFSCTYSGESPVILLYNQDSSVLIAAFYIAEQNSKTAQLPADCTKLRIVVRIDDANSAPNGTVLTLNGLQLEVGSTPSAFAPYHGKLHTVQIGQTVYGCRFDWLTGKLVVEWTMTALNGNEFVNREENVNGSGNARFSISAAVPGIMPMPEANIGMQCSHYYTAFNPIGNNDRNACICGFQGMDTVFIRDDAHASVEAYKAYLAAQYAAGTPVQIVYKLANPIEIQFTPRIISAADPEQTNTLYGDGRIDAEYVKPLHVSIEERVAAAVAAAMQTE